MRCDDVAVLLPGISDGVSIADRDVAAHVESCLRCQAELVQYRKLLKALHQLRTQILEPAPGLLADILAGLEAAGERRAVRSMLQGKYVAYAGGIAAATAAASVGALLLAHRARERRLALAS
jgi:hypothetical protein